MTTTTMVSLDSTDEVVIQSSLKRPKPSNTGKVLRACACLADIGGMATLWAFNHHVWGQNKLVDLTAFISGSIAFQGIMTSVVARKIGDRYHNFSNRWLLETSEALGAAIDNLPPGYIAYQVNALGVCFLKTGAVMRTTVAAFSEGHRSLHLTYPADFKRIYTPMLLDGPYDSVPWITLAEAVEIAAAGTLLALGFKLKNWEFISYGLFTAGYAAGIAGRGVIALKSWLQKRSLRQIDYTSLYDTPQASFAAGTLQRLVTITSDSYGLIIASLLSSPYTLFFAGSALRMTHDSHLIKFQAEELIRPADVPSFLPEPNEPRAYVQAAFKVDNVLKSLLVGGMMAYISFAMAESAPPSIAALAAFTAGLFTGYGATLAVYYTYHKTVSPEQSRLLRQLYFWLALNNEAIPVLFCLIRRAMQLNDVTQDHAPLPTQILGALAFALFGFSWGNNTALQWLINEQKASGYLPPPFVAQFLLGIKLTELFKEAIYDPYSY